MSLNFNKPPPPPVSPDTSLVKKNSETLERELIFGMIRHYPFYREMRERICIFDSQTEIYKQDFTVEKYNLLYQLIDGYWRRYDNVQNWTDLAGTEGITREQLEAFVVDWCNAKLIAPELYTELIEELRDDAELLRTSTLEGCRVLARSAGFKAWLEARALAGAVRALKFQMSKGLITKDSLLEAAETAKARSVTPEVNWYNAGALARSKIKFLPAISSGITKLDQAAGGGFRKGDTWLVAGCPGGGKTILANQFLWNFAEQGKNVVYITTEQKPAQLIPRIIANAATVDMSEFQDEARNIIKEKAGTEEEFSVDVIPEALWEDPRLKSRLDYITKVLAERVLFIDWASGNKRSVVKDLEPELEYLAAEFNWNADALLFDWLGGALETAVKPEHLRFTYKEAADSFIALNRRKSYAGIMFAQVNQLQAANKQRVTMAMLAESKSIADRMHGFIGISSMYEKTTLEAGDLSPRLQRFQWLNIDKSRTGPAGLVKVIANFKFQRFDNSDGANTIADTNE